MLECLTCGKSVCATGSYQMYARKPIKSAVPFTPREEPEGRPSFMMTSSFLNTGDSHRPVGKPKEKGPTLISEKL